MQFEEFRLSLTPDLQAPGQWAVQVTECPTAMLRGPKGTASIQVTPQQLSRLRSAAAWPNEAELRQIGTAVWQSIMSAQADAAFKACLATAQGQHKSLRLVISVIGDRPDSLADGAVAPDELPIEALFDNTLRFIATDPALPLSRGAALAPDRGPVKLAPPLRILVVAAAPTDQPPVGAAAERAAVSGALKSLVDNGAVQLEFCEPPTKEQFRVSLQKGFHVVHFIGHGAYRVVASDPTPRAHLCFEDETPQRETDPVDAEQLLVMLRASTVQLVVLTSCASAAPLPPGPGARYPGAALGGIAQLLLAQPTGPAAAVAMQFDLETDAAVVFSRTLYQGLLRSDWTLDEAVADARRALLLKFGAGHRCSVNPVVLWRSIGGRLFEWDAFVGDGLVDSQRSQLMQIDLEEKLVLDQLSFIAAQPANIRDAVAPLAGQWHQRIEELARLRGDILGETLRLHGGTVAVDGSIECRLTLKLRRPVQVGDVQVQVGHDAAVFAADTTVAASGLAAAGLFVQAGPGAGRTLLMRNVSAGQVLEPGEHDLALLRFLRLPGAAAGGIYRFELKKASAMIDGQARQFRGLDAIVFGS